MDNIISAAALGRVALVDRFVGNDGRLRSGAPLVRVPWPALPANPDVHVGYALAWACVFGQDEVVELLLRKGVDPSGRDGDATALHQAAAYGRVDLVRLLVAYGASLEVRNAYGGTVLDGTIWYAFNDPQPGVDYVEVVRVLIEAGARTDVYSEMRPYVDAVLSGQERPLL